MMVQQLYVFCFLQIDTFLPLFEAAINAIKFLVLPKKFGPLQKFLGPVKGQGIQFQQLKLIKLLEIWKRK